MKWNHYYYFLTINYAILETKFLLYNKLLFTSKYFRDTFFTFLLCERGKGGNLIRKMKIIYEEIDKMVRIKERLIDLLGITKGVRHGCIMSP